MVADLQMNLEIVAVPTVREPDGLAMSSRNTYLNPEERKAATVLYRALNLARQLHSQGETDAERLHQEMTTLIEREPLATIDYVSVAHSETLEELNEVNNTSLVSMAVRIGKTRLIDNIVLL
jgi:pantoate--beta-alanine ligase